MRQVVSFLIKNSYRLLFFTLLGIALTLTVQSHSIHRSSYVNSSLALSGYVYEKTNEVKDYFRLAELNQGLVAENRYLKELLFNKADTVVNYKTQVPKVVLDYKIVPAKVIKNSFRSQENYLTLKGGSSLGIMPDMGVVNSKGIVGVVDKTTLGYSTVVSVLNIKQSINAKIKHSDHYGSLIWNGKNLGYVQLIDVPRLATVKKGDTIVTGGYSDIFPENIPVGSIDKVYIDRVTNNYTINIRLFNDMTNLGYVYVIENKNKKEMLEIAQKLKNE